MFVKVSIFLPVLLFCVTTLSGCTKKEPNPELKDPIYLDLKGLVGNAEKSVTENEAALEDSFIRLKEAEPRTKDVKLAKKSITENRRKVTTARQNLKYLKIKMERRKMEARISYGKAFESGKEWPDPKEFAAYKASKRLKSANLNWGARVPKLQDRIDSMSAKPEEKK